MGATYDSFALILGLIALGMLCARLRMFPDNAAEVLNRFVLYVCLPAAVLRFASQLQPEPAMLALIAVPWLLLGLVVWLVGRSTDRLALRDDERAVLLLCVPLGNTSFLGYPLTEALAGRAALPHAVIYDQFGSFLMLSTWGLWVLARYGGDAPPRPKDLLRRLLGFPPFLALLAALFLMPDTPPVWMERLLARLSDALLPIVAVAIGLQLQLRVPRDERRPLLFGLAVKLLLLPFVALLLAWLFGFGAPMRAAAVLESAMPPMISASALAISHRLAPGLAAALVGFGVLLSMLTLPLWAAVLAWMG